MFKLIHVNIFFCGFAICVGDWRQKLTELVSLLHKKKLLVLENQNNRQTNSHRFWTW